MRRSCSARRRNAGRSRGGYQIGYEIWDLERLRRFRSSGATHEPVTVDFSRLPGGGIRCVPVSDAALGYQTCVAIVPGQVLYELYDEHGARLLELNVRSYLQARGKINKEILETLLLKPQLFLAYNNGITIVAEAIHLDGTGTLITGVHGLQIVNGGQTTASIHRARKENKADLTHVFVQAKLTVVPADQFEVMVPEISRLSNTQNKVSDRRPRRQSCRSTSVSSAWRARHGRPASSRCGSTNAHAAHFRQSVTRTGTTHGEANRVRQEISGFAADHQGGPCPLQQHVGRAPARRQQGWSEEL